MGNGKFLVITSGNYGIIGECQRPPRTALKSMDALAHKETGFFYRDLGLNLHLAHFSRTGKMPVPQRVNFLVGWAGEPAHKRLIENGAISQFKPSILV
jgi:hypothetical protein